MEIFVSGLGTIEDLGGGFVQLTWFRFTTPGLDQQEPVLKMTLPMRSLPSVGHAIVNWWDREKR